MFIDDINIQNQKDQFKHDLIKAFIEARNEKHLTQKELAKLVGTRQSNISRFESGKYNPSINFLQKLAIVLDKDLEISFQ